MTTLTLRLSGLRALILDLIAAGQRPVALLLSENEKRDIKQEMLDCAPLIRIGEHGPEEVPDNEAICILEGVPVMSSPDVPSGKAWIVPQDCKTVSVH